MMRAGLKDKLLKKADANPFLLTEMQHPFNNRLMAGALIQPDRIGRSIGVNDDFIAAYFTRHRSLDHPVGEAISSFPRIN